MGIKNETQNNTEAETRNETQNNSKNGDEEYPDEVGDSESIHEDGNNQSETEQCFNIRKKRAPNYRHMKTVGYLSAHVKKSHLNVLSAIAKFHKPDIETTLVINYLLSQYAMKKGINLFGERGVRELRK